MIKSHPSNVFRKFMKFSGEDVYCSLDHTVLISETFSNFDALVFNV